MEASAAVGHLAAILHDANIENFGTKAQQLLDEFGTLGAVFAGSRTRQRRATGDDRAVDVLRRTNAAMRYALRAETRLGPIVSNSASLRDYLFAGLAFESKEQVRVLYLNAGNAIVRDEIETRGTQDQVSLHVREIVARALEIGATRVLLVHNHPSGDPRPSGEDVARTNMLIDACRPLGVHVVDHLIVGRLGVSSLRESGAIR